MERRKMTLLKRILLFCLFFVLFRPFSGMAGYRLPEGWEMFKSSRSESYIAADGRENAALVVKAGSRIGLATKVSSTMIQVRARLVNLPKEAGSSFSIYIRSADGVLLQLAWERTQNGQIIRFVPAKDNQTYKSRIITWNHPIAAVSIVRQMDNFIAYADAETGKAVSVGTIKWPGLSPSMSVGLVAEFPFSKGNAREQAFRFTDLDIDTPESYVEQASYFAAVGDEEQLFETLNLANAVFGKTALLYDVLAYFYGRFNRIDEMMDVLKKSIALDNSNPASLNSLGYQMALQGRDYNTATEFLKKAVALDPKNPDYHDSLGWAHFKNGKTALAQAELKKALTLVRNSRRISPATVELFEHLGTVYDATGDRIARDQLFSEAVQILKAGLARDENAYVSAGLGWFYFKTGKLQEALPILKKAAEGLKKSDLNEKHASKVYERLAKVYLAHRDRSRAIESYMLARDNFYFFNMNQEADLINIKIRKLSK
jgi:tetratricopeptide (TPR) repeat protein